MTIGEALKAERKRLGLSQSQMTGNLITKSHYSKIERGLFDIRTNDLLTILNLHNIDVVEFFKKISVTNQEENTKAYRKVMENPYVNIIGHPDDGRYPVDFEELVLGAKEQHVLLEVNNNSLDPRCTREKGEENVRTMLAFCEKYQVPVVVNSDAHTDALVGCHCYAEKIIEDMRFPEELIVNRSTDALKKFLKKIQ